MKDISLVIAGSLLVLALISPLTALELKGVVGLHNNYIPDEKHHTLALGIGAYIEHETQSEVHVSAYFDWFFDDDNEEIDEDRYDNWFQSGFNLYAKVSSLSKNSNLIWEVDGDMRYNTVNYIEAYYKGFVGLIPQYYSENYLLGLGLYGGYYYFELDDDISEGSGFVNDDLVYESLAYYAKGRFDYSFTKSLEFKSMARQYRDDKEWLQNQLTLDLVYDISRFIDNSEVIFNTEYDRYNFSHIQSSNTRNVTALHEEEWNTRFFTRIAF